MKKFWIMTFLFCSVMTYSQGKLKYIKDSFKIPQSGKYIVTENQSHSSQRDEIMQDFFSGTAFLRAVLLQPTYGLVYYVTVESPLNANAKMVKVKIEPYAFHYGSKGNYTYQAQNSKWWRLDTSIAILTKPTDWII